MSVVPVREAIRRLEAEGLVTFERNVGARVSMIDDSQYRHSMETLAILEGAATALAARHLTADDVRQARELNRRLVESLDDFDPRLLHLAEPRSSTRCSSPPARTRACSRSSSRSGSGWATCATRRSASCPAARRSRCASTRPSSTSSRPAHPWRTSSGRPAAHRSATLAAYLSHEHPDEAPVDPGRDDRTLRGATCPPTFPTRIQHYIGGELVDSAGRRDVRRCSTRCRTRRTCTPRPARRPTSTGPSPRPGARSTRDRGRGCCRASDPGCCTAIADIVESRDARLAELESFDTGLPITQALGQARRAAENFRFFADLIVAQADDAFKVPGRQLNYVNRKPIGVAGLITPWNTPFMLESWKLGPGARDRQHRRAEARGVHAAVGVPVGRDLRGGRRCPTGVFNLVHGLGEEAGDALVKHPDVPLISFTGESRTGQLIFAQRGAVPEGPVDGARRQVPRRGLRRRRPRGGDRRDDLRGLLAQRRAVHRGQPDPRAARGLRRVRRALRRAGVARRRRPPARAEHRGRRARAPGALRQGHVATSRSARPRGGSSPAAGGPTASRPATTWHRPCSPTSRRTRGSSRRRSSARSSRSPRSTPTRRRSRSPTACKYGLAAYVWTNDLRRAHTFAQAVEAGHGLAQLQQRPRPAHPVRRRQGLRARPRGRLPLDRLLHRTSRPCTSRSARRTTRPSAKDTDVSAPTPGDPESVVTAEARSRRRPVPTPSSPPPDILRARLHGARRHRPRGLAALLRRRPRPRRDRGGRRAPSTCAASRSSSTTTSSCARVRSPRSPRSPTGSAPPRTSTRRSRSTASSGAGSSGGRTASRRASATRCASRTRSASPTSSSTTSSTSSGSRGATTCTRRARSCASTTSTRSPPTCRAPWRTWRTSGSG